MHYEVGVCVSRLGGFVWVNGPFPAVEWSDLQIAKSALIHHMEDDDFCVADGGLQ